MLLRVITTRLLDRQLARSLARVIPHPGLRMAATLATSVLIPFVVEHGLARVVAHAARRRLHGGAVAG